MKKNQNSKRKSFYLNYEDEKIFSMFLEESILQLDFDILSARLDLLSSGWSHESEMLNECINNSQRTREVLSKIKSSLDRKYM